MLEQMQMIAFQIIASVGTAKSNYVEAMQAAKKGDFELADSLIKEGDEILLSEAEHHSNYVPWHFLRKSKNIKINFAEINDDPVIHIADEFDNLFIITKNTDINIFKKDLNKFFLEIDNFDSKKFNKLYSPSALIEKLDTF